MGKGKEKKKKSEIKREKERKKKKSRKLSKRSNETRRRKVYITIEKITQSSTCKSICKYELHTDFIHQKVVNTLTVLGKDRLYELALGGSMIPKEVS